jgi:hypothetical protein
MVRKDSTGTAADKGKNSTKPIEDQSEDLSPTSKDAYSPHRPEFIQLVPSSSDSITNATAFYDRFDRREVAAAPYVHPTTVKPVVSSRRFSVPLLTTVPLQSDGRDHPEQNYLSKPLEVISQIASNRLASQAPPLANASTPPVSNMLSPSLSTRSSKVEIHASLPARNTLLKLVEIYFTRVNNQTYGFLHRSTFLRHLEEGKVPDGLLYSICAISARFSPTDAPPPLPRQSGQQAKDTAPYTAGEPYAVEARKLALRDFDKPTVQNVQTLLLLALHDFGCKKGQKAWMFAGMAIRMASALRLNREVDGDAIGFESAAGGGTGPAPVSRTGAASIDSKVTTREKVSWTEREIRRRTFWACFIMDVSSRQET